MVILISPLLASSKRDRFEKTRRIGCLNHDLLGNGEGQPVIHSSIGTVMILAIRNHAQTTKPISKQVKQLMQTIHQTS